MTHSGTIAKRGSSTNRVPSRSSIESEYWVSEVIS